MTDLWATIKAIQPALPGWCSPEKAEALAALVIALRPETSLEIGIYGGSSFLPIALAHQHIKTGTAYGIDPWDALASMKNESQENQAWWRMQDYGKLHSDFMAKLMELDLYKWTHIFHKRSDEVTPPTKIDLLHIDGSHTDQAVRDVTRFASRVRLGGVVVMDDQEWTGGMVKVAIRNLLNIGFMQLYRLGSGAAFQRIK